jgi:hypothetical protein
LPPLAGCGAADFHFGGSSVSGERALSLKVDPTFDERHKTKRESGGVAEFHGCSISFQAKRSWKSRKHWSQIQDRTP